jgi:hypothetical protein
VSNLQALAGVLHDAVVSIVGLASHSEANLVPIALRGLDFYIAAP